MAQNEDTARPSRSQMAVHEGQVAYIESEKGVDLSKLSPAEVIAHAYATRVAWRKTDDYKSIRETAKAGREEAAAERKAARAAAKAAKAGEAKAEKATKKAPAKKATGAKRATKSTKSTKSTTEADPFA